MHIGHLAGVYVPADIYVRYLRLKKRDVLFVCGSDEHGVPVTIRARKEGCTPQEVVDRYNKIIRLVSLFGVEQLLHLSLHHAVLNLFKQQGRFAKHVTLGQQVSSPQEIGRAHV